MNGHRHFTAAVLVAMTAACASPGTPPGGPIDRNPPTIVKVSPDSGATNVKAGAVTVRFNEVINEKPRGAPELSGIVVLSPSDGPARVKWERDAITVRPRRGFRPNTAYALTIMPGLTDLSGNATPRGRTYVFSTGTAIPRGVVRGAVFDWTTLRPAGGAVIDARIGTDSTFRWIARTDSAGRYTIPLLPPGTYTIRALLDANENGKMEPRELWDSSTVNVADSLRLDLYTFAHDTLGARIVGADVKDSLTLRLSFDRPLALTPALTVLQLDLLNADSSHVRVLSLMRATAYDSLAHAREAAAKDSALRADTSAAGRRARARADSVRLIAERDSIENARVEARRASRDTVVHIPLPVPTRPAITADYVAVLAAPLPPGNYRVRIRDAVSASLVTRTSERTFTRAKPAEKKAEPDKPVEKKAEPDKPAAKQPEPSKPARPDE